VSTSAQQQPKVARDALVRPALLALLAAPWAAHAAITGLSALGSRPLAARWVALGIVGFAVLVTAVGVHRAVQTKRDDEVIVSPVTGVAGRLCGAMSAGAVLALAGAVLAALALPLIAYDALGYHLPVIADWLDAGRVAWVTTDDPIRNGYPLGQEAIGALLAAATGSTSVVTLPSFFYVVAGALSIWHFSERMGVRRELSRAAAALFLLVPIVILNAPTGYVDASFAGAVVSCFLLSALAFGDARPDFVLVAAAGMAAAHALSLKGTGVSTLLAASGATAVVLVARRLAGSPLPAAFARRLGVAAVFAAPGAFWLVRNVVHTGNPLWPVAIRVAGHDLFSGVAPLAAIMDAAHNTPPALARLNEASRLAHTWLEWAGPAVAFDDRFAGLGLAWPLVALPAIVFTVVRLFRGGLAPERRTPLAIALVATAIAFLLQPMRWWPRYTIWLWGLGAVSVAYAAESLVRAGKGRTLAAALSVATGLAAVEGSIALFHSNGLGAALAHSGAGALFASDPRTAPNALDWVDATFWKSGVADADQVCRGSWKPGTDDAILDGVFAQLSPRPHVHVVLDDDGNWSRVHKAWKDAGCTDLLLLQGSPVLPLAEKDPEVSVEPAVAFDPLFIVRPRALTRLSSRNEPR
jgi:hypothetical protein